MILHCVEIFLGTVLVMIELALRSLVNLIEEMSAALRCANTMPAIAEPAVCVVVFVELVGSTQSRGRS